jgi:hypothetical protein
LHESEAEHAARASRAVAYHAWPLWPPCGRHAHFRASASGSYSHGATLALGALGALGATVAIDALGVVLEALAPERVPEKVSEERISCFVVPVASGARTNTYTSAIVVATIAKIASAAPTHLHCIFFSEKRLFLIFPVLFVFPLF